MTKSRSKISLSHWPLALPPKEELAALDALINWLEAQEIKPVEACPILARALVHALRSCTYDRQTAADLGGSLMDAVVNTIEKADIGDEEW